jgi:hypothetical protein
VQPKQHDEGKYEEAVDVQFYCAVKIAVSEKQKRPCDSAARAGDAEQVFQQTQPEDLPVKGRDDSRSEENPGQKYEDARSS